LNRNNLQKRIRFIVNPFSGVSRKKNIETRIEKELDHRQFSFEVCYTEGPGHATVLSREAVELGVNVVVAVGGDGSVNEVAAALIGTDTILGIVPAGSGNGFAMHLGLGRDIDKAIRILNTAQPTLIDTAMLNDQPYVNLAGVGFDASVAYRLKKSTFRGLFAYLYYAILETFQYQMQRYRIQLDNQESFERECLLVEIANSPMFGYNFRIAPQAKLKDGLLEVVLVKKVPKWRYLFSLWRFLNNSFHKSSLVECYSARQIEINLAEEAPIHFDGEGFLSCHNLKISVNPLSLHVLTPKVSLAL